MYVLSFTTHWKPLLQHWRSAAHESPARSRTKTNTLNFPSGPAKTARSQFCEIDALKFPSGPAKTANPFWACENSELPLQPIL